jgi:SH3 domain protein
MSRRRRGLLAFVFALGASIPGASVRAGAETAWVRGEVRLNLRAEPGNEQRILGTVAVGEAVEVLDRGPVYARVRSAGGLEGWLPNSRLDDTAPASARLGEAEQQAAELRERLAATGAEVQELRDARQALETEREQQAARAQQEREAAAQRDALRWPDWVAGASLFAAGMALGALLRGVSGQNRRSRIRL